MRVEKRHVYAERELTSEPAESVDSAGDGVRVGHLSDLHLGKPVEGRTVPERLEAWLEAFERHGVDWIALSGDLVEATDDRVGMLRIRRLLETSKMDWVVVPGNHDIGEPGGRAAFHELFGGYPRVEAREGVEWILFDSMSGLPVEERTPYEHLDADRTGAYARGRVGEEALRVAEGRLVADDEPPRAMVVHHHLRAVEAVPADVPKPGAPETLMVPALDSDRVTAWAARHGVDVVFHGHQHAFWPPYCVEDGPVVLNSGSSTRGKPRCRARLVDLGAETVVWDLVAEFGESVD